MAATKNELSKIKVHIFISPDQKKISLECAHAHADADDDGGERHDRGLEEGRGRREEGCRGEVYPGFFCINRSSFGCFFSNQYKLPLSLQFADTFNKAIVIVTHI